MLILERLLEEFMIMALRGPNGSGLVIDQKDRRVLPVFRESAVLNAQSLSYNMGKTLPMTLVRTPLKALYRRKRNPLDVVKQIKARYTSAHIDTFFPFTFPECITDGYVGLISAVYDDSEKEKLHAILNGLLRSLAEAGYHLRGWCAPVVRGKSHFVLYDETIQNYGEIDLCYYIMHEAFYPIMPKIAHSLRLHTTLYTALGMQTKLLSY